MPALVAGIHVLLPSPHVKTWMAGTSPAMTAERWFDMVNLPIKSQTSLAIAMRKT